MSETKYFVMLRGATGMPILMVSSEELDDAALFDSEEEAESAAKKNILGEHFRVAKQAREGVGFRVGQRVRPTDSNPYYHRYARKGAKVTMVSRLDSRYLQVNGDWWAAHFWKPWKTA